MIMNLKDRSDLMTELEAFLQFLLKEGYCDVDVYAEPPTAIDRYMEQKYQTVLNEKHYINSHCPIRAQFHTSAN